MMGPLDDEPSPYFTRVLAEPMRYDFNNSVTQAIPYEESRRVFITPELADRCSLWVEICANGEKTRQLKGYTLTYEQGLTRMRCYMKMWNDVGLTSSIDFNDELFVPVYYGEPAP